MREHRRIRPFNIRFWIDERPSLPLSLMAALQQLALLGSIMTVSLVFTRKIGLNPADTAGVMSLTMLAAGVGTVMQALNRFGVGSGLLVPMQASGAAFRAMQEAVALGGLGLAFGMCAAIGLVQLIFGRLMRRLRSFFPVEIAGLAVFLIGVELSLIGVDGIIEAGDVGTGRSYAVSGLTFGIIVAMSVWLHGLGQSFAVFTGLILGQAAAWWFGEIPAGAFAIFDDIRLFAVPEIARFGWSMDWRLLLDFMVVGVVLSWNCYAISIVAQRSYDSGWKRTDVPAVERSLIAEGITNIAASLMNGIAQTSSGPGVGLAQASGIVSRRVAYFLGALFVGMSFFPPVVMMWSILSSAVVGSVLLFVGSFVLVTGLKIMTSRLLDERKTLILGIAFIGGLKHEYIVEKIGHWEVMHADIVFGSPLTTALLIAIALNALFLIGGRKRRTRDIALEDDWPEKVNRIIWNLGHQWGGRPEVVAHLENAANQVIDAIVDAALIEGEEKVRLSVDFDDFECVLRILYSGKSLRIPDRLPELEEIVESPDTVQDIAGHLIRRLADEVSVSHSSGVTEVSLCFRE